MSDFGAAFRETLRRIASDRSASSALIGAVVLYSFFYPAPYSSQLAIRQPVAVVDLDRSPMSRALIRNTLAVQALEVKELGGSFAVARANPPNASDNPPSAALLCPSVAPFPNSATSPCRPRRMSRWKSG